MTETTEIDTDGVEDLGAFVIDGHARHYDFYLDDRPHSAWGIMLDLTEDERVNGDYDPMINTLWPLPERSGGAHSWTLPEDAKERMETMTVVEVHDLGEPGLYLALTGGGMDLSRSIARTYVNLGLLPPASLGRLPGGITDPDDPGDQRAAAALRQSHSLMIGRHERDMTEIDRVMDDA